MSRSAFWLTGTAAFAVIFSVAASQILMALALAALLLSDTRLRLPPVWMPLALFAAGTVVSLLLSGDMTTGRPQLRKFFVFAILLLVYSTFRELDHLRRLALAWAGAAAITSARGVAQFVEKYQEAVYAGRNFYEHYVGERISGFMSHWMTFSGLILTVFLVTLAFVCFSPSARRKQLWFAGFCLLLAGVAVVLGFTRSIWLAGGVSTAWLLWRWNRKALLALPVVLALVVWATPGVRTRLLSMFAPKQEVDSNLHRIVCWRTGWNMIRAHPWFGLGPEQVRVQFERYVPADVPRPLPTGWYGHLHNIYIHYAAERGVPTMLMLVWLLGQVIVDMFRGLRKTARGRSDERFLMEAALAVTLAIAVAGVFELNLGDSEVLTLFLAVVAAGYVARDRALERPAGEAP